LKNESQKTIDMITKIDTGIPINTNNRILDNLYAAKNWYFGFDENNFMNKDQKDAGFLIVTYKENQDYYNNDILNTYAQFIFDVVNNKSLIKFKKITRIYWNWYHPGSVMQFHMDNKEDNAFSIIYNLHNNDGGTEFKINNKIDFYKSIASEAIVFPSKLYHRGIAPKLKPNRFCLNIMLEI